MTEPLIHSFADDGLSEDDPRAYTDIACSVCKCAVHAANNECMTPWVEHGGVVWCWADFLEAYPSDRQGSGSWPAFEEPKITVARREPVDPTEEHHRRLDEMVNAFLDAWAEKRDSAPYNIEVTASTTSVECGRFTVRVSRK